MSAERVVIIGGGISGLSVAYFLLQHGRPSTILEKANRLGGLIQTDHLDGCDLEAGPDSYISTKPAVTDLAKELSGLSQKIIGSNDERRKIFIVQDGKLVPLPAGMVMIAPSQWAPVLQSGLFSAITKLRFLQECFTRPKDRIEDVSIEDFVQDHFTRQVLEYIAEPLLSGVYGGDVAKLSAQSVLPRFVEYERKYGSLIRGVHGEGPSKRSGSLFLSFERGMQTLIDVLSESFLGQVDVIHAEARKVERAGSHWRIHSGNTWQDAEHVVLACPAYIGAQLLDSVSSPLSSELSNISYSSAILAVLVFDQTQVRHSLDGFGFLVPRRERRSVAAVTWINTKFPSRIRPGLSALRAFIVGDDAEKLMGLSNEDLTALARSEFQRLMGIDAAPVFSTVNRWPQSMPQYVVGYQARIDRIGAALEELPGLHLVGNAYDGVGIPDCVARAKRIAGKIAGAATSG